MMHDKDKLLLKIANAIVANIGNTTDIGLMNGNTGVCLFLYEYSRYSGIEYYEDVANGLLESEVKRIANDLRLNTINSISEFGIGLVKLVERMFVEEGNETIFEKIDKYLLNSIAASFKEYVREKGNAHFSPAVYFLYRIVYSKKSNLVDAFVASMNSQIDCCLKENTRLAYNLLCVFKIIKFYCKSELLQKAIKFMENNMEPDTFISLPCIFEIVRCLYSANKLSGKYDNKTLWWRYIYDITGRIMPEHIEGRFVRDELTQMFNEANNNKFSVIGLLILGKYEKKN